MRVHEGIVFSEVIEATPEEIRELDSLLSFSDPDAYHNPAFKAGFWDGNKHFLYRHQAQGGHYFYSGVLPFIREKFSGKIQVRKKMRGSTPTVAEGVLFNMRLSGKFAYQLRAANESLKAERGILHLATNAGKTVIATAMTSALQKKTLFAVPTSFLQTQAFDTFASETPFTLGLIGGGVKSNLDIADVVVGVFKSLALKAEEDPEWFEQFEVLFIDECHTGSSDTVEKIFTACTNARYRFGLSGTPLDLDEIRNIKLIGHLGPVVSRITNKELIELGVSAKPIITIHSVTESSEIPLDGTWESCYTANVVENKIRNEKIVEIVRKAVHHEEVTLILVHEERHGKLLQQMLADEGIRASFCNGKSNITKRTKAITRLKNGDDLVLILSRIGEAGLDIPLLDVVVRATGWKSKVSVLQALGRGLRGKKDKENVVYFHDFHDSIDKYTRKHSLNRIKTYEREGLEVHYEPESGQETADSSTDSTSDRRLQKRKRGVTRSL